MNPIAIHENGETREAVARAEIASLYEKDLLTEKEACRAYARLGAQANIRLQRLAGRLNDIVEMRSGVSADD